MKAHSLLAAVFLAGCATLNDARDTLIPKSREQQLAENKKLTLDAEVRTIRRKFNDGLPVVSAKGVRTIPADKEERFYSMMATMPAFYREITERDRQDLKALRKHYDLSEATHADMTRTKDFIEQTINESVANIDNDWRASEAFREHCRYSARNQCDVKNDIRSDILRALFSARPEYSRYFDLIAKTTTEWRKLADDVAAYGLETERKLFVERANKLGCKGVTAFRDPNEWPLFQAVGFANGFTPAKTEVFDMGGFRVIGPAPSGVLMRPEHSGAISPPFIILTGGEPYPDDFVIQPQTVRACYVGLTEYVTVLGAQKRVWSFQAIKDDREYYFLPN